MVHSLLMAGGSHQSALTAAPLSHGRIDTGRDGEGEMNAEREGKRIMLGTKAEEIRSSAVRSIRGRIN